MLCSLAVTKVNWSMCPTDAWKGQFPGKEGKATISLEVVVDSSLWFWHSVLLGFQAH
jgi:hypothetical protein